MYLTFKINLSGNMITKNYRSLILSYLKNAFQTNDIQLYKKYYGRTYSLKDFCFSVYFDNPKFNQDFITLDSNQMIIKLSTMDISCGIDIYNALLKMKNKEYITSENSSLTLIDIKIENHKTITKNEIIIKMQSPLIVRTHVNNKDRYLSYKDTDFIDCLKNSIEYTLKECTNIDLSNRNLKIMCISPKKTVVDAFGAKITANLGVYKIIADVDVINAMYQLGIGSRRSEGFGMFEVIA